MKISPNKVDQYSILLAVITSGIIGAISTPLIHSIIPWILFLGIRLTFLITDDPFIGMWMFLWLVGGLVVVIGGLSGIIAGSIGSLLAGRMFRSSRTHHLSIVARKCASMCAHYVPVDVRP